MVAVAGLLSFAAPHRSRADQRSLPVLTRCGVLHDAIEWARLIFQARRELPGVTAVASQVLLVDRRLAQAKEALRHGCPRRPGPRPPTTTVTRPGATRTRPPAMATGRRQPPTWIEVSPDTKAAEQAPPAPAPLARCRDGGYRVSPGPCRSGRAGVATEARHDLERRWLRGPGAGCKGSCPGWRWRQIVEPAPAA
jgi:hypothetical protein